MDHASVINRHQRSNFFQTTLLLLAMTAIMCGAGYLLFDVTGMLIALGLLATGTLFSQQMSSAMILRAYRARPIPHRDAPELVELVRSLAVQADLSPPPLIYIPSRMPNAFAAGTGRGAFIAVTDGLLRLLDRRELAGVLAHELAHIVNRDIRVLGIADTITRTTSMLARFGLLLMLLSFSSILWGGGWFSFLLAGTVLFFAPALLTVLQLAISRTREFDADLTAVELTGDPLGLASALQKITPSERPGMMERILRPGERRGQPGMLRTHPPTEERVARLVELGKLQQKHRPTEFQNDPRHPMAYRMAPVQRSARYHPLSGMWH